MGTNVTRRQVLAAGAVAAGSVALPLGANAAAAKATT